MYENNNNILFIEWIYNELKIELIAKIENYSISETKNQITLK